MKSKEQGLFSAHERALEQEFETCPACGGSLSLKHSKSGPFLGCDTYPKCDYTRPLAHAESTTLKTLDDMPCPECGNALALKNGRFGIFVGCSAYPECHHIESMHKEKEVKPFAACPVCTSGELVSRKSRHGKTFYACDKYPKCKFAVNYEPVADSCQECGFPLLIKRKLAAGDKLQCADKKCAKYQS